MSTARSQRELADGGALTVDTDYACLRLDERGSVLRVTVDHPPINLLDAALRADLDRLSIQLSTDDAFSVVVIASADPDFFIAHADVFGLLGRTVRHYERRGVLGQFQAMLERWRTLPQATIGELRGAARGGGLEFLLSLDMVYAATENAVVSLPEVALGIIPGGGGTQRLATAAGRSRALEVILSCNDIDAATAAAYGLVTRNLPNTELTTFVDVLARRIACWPRRSIQLAKQAVDAARPAPTDGLLDEYHYFNAALADHETEARLRRFLAAGGQSREGERDLGRNLPGMVSDADLSDQPYHR
ncbi:MAG: enoyl-CoA hydratase/isomerase family protein [bacterium]|nr:enoyl-CoA hydratase/isomerase family protein [bacterium]